MAGIAMKIVILTLIMLACPPLYAEDSTGAIVNNAPSCSFSDWVNTNPKSAAANDDKAALRQYWKETIGIDMFYPYFKAKALETKIKEKTSVNILKIKGKPEINEDGVKYIFKIKF